MNRQPGVILVLICLSIVCLACPASAQAPLTPEQKQLVKAQTEKERAQVRYYQGQLELSRKQIEMNRPKEYHNFWDKYTDKDPADLVESTGVMIGVLVLLGIWLTGSRAARRDNRDMQFYEALRRFGDPTSPAVRMAAAGAVAQMGQSAMYADTAVDQLLAGLILEEDPVVRMSVRNALLSLSRANPGMLASRLDSADPELLQKARSILGDLPKA